MTHPVPQSFIGFAQKEAELADRDRSVKAERDAARTAAKVKIDRLRALRLAGRKAPSV